MPKRVAIVAWALVAVGAASLAAAFLSVLRGGFEFLNPSFLLLPAGLALFQRHRPSRRWATNFLVLVFVLDVVGLVLLFLLARTAHITLGTLGERGLKDYVTLVWVFGTPLGCAAAIWMLHSGPAKAYFAPPAQVSVQQAHRADGVS